MSGILHKVAIKSSTADTYKALTETGTWAPFPNDVHISNKGD